MYGVKLTYEFFHIFSNLFKYARNPAMIASEQIQQIRSLLSAGLSPTAIAHEMKVSTASVYKYGKVHQSNNITKQDGEVGGFSFSKKLEPFSGFIDEQLRNGTRNAKKICKKLQENGFLGSYSLVNNYIRYRGVGGNKNRAYQKVETAPGEQAQVDWGYFGKIAIDNRVFNLYAFVYVLSFSRALYAEFTTSQKQHVFQECHIHAFEKLGVPKKIRYDNVKTVVVSRKKSADGEDVINFNFDFLNFARYYKFEADPCPLYYPQAKGKVESAVKYIRNNFMNGEKYKRTFHSISMLNEKLWVWLEQIANQRMHATTNEQPHTRWLKEKKDLFLIDGYPRYQNNLSSSRRASQNSMVTFKRSSYWVPNCYARKKIDIVETHDNGVTKLVLHFKGNEIIEYIASAKPGGWILPDDMSVFNPDEKKDTSKKKKNDLLNTSVEIRNLEYYDKFINL